MIFSVEDRLFDLFPDLQVGILVARVDNTKYGDDILDPVIERVRKHFKDTPLEGDRRIRAWREALSRAGMTDKGFTSSIEHLVTRVLKGGVFPRVNPLVDLYTAVSLESFVPVGGHDISCIDGDMVLGFAKGNERFTPMEGGEEEVVGEGEVIYRDGSAALTRGWVWRQSNKDRVSADTHSVLMPIDVLEPSSSSSATDIIDRLQAYLKDSGSGQVIYRNTVTKESRTVRFDI